LDDLTISRRADSALPNSQTYARILKYALIKAITLFITVAIGLYLTITVLNLGGYVDKIFSANIDEAIGAQIQGGWLRDVPEPERTQTINETRLGMQRAAGLDQPYLLRSLRWLWNGLTLNLGPSRAQFFYSVDSGEVESIVLRHLPYTLVLVGLANILVFFASITIALVLSHKPGSRTDRLMMFLAPLSATPSWIFGVLLIVILVNQLRLLPPPKSFDINEMVMSLDYLKFLGRQMIMPVLAIFLGTFFVGVYSWRAFFVIYSNEDYVEIARAKGLPNRLLERQYILRPVLPYVITSFAVMMITLWQGAIALELLFRWPGVGVLFITAIRSVNTPLTLGVVVVFAYMLALTVFILDVVYALVDPRVRVGGDNQSAQAKLIGRRKLFRWRRTPPVTGTLLTDSQAASTSPVVKSPAAKPSLKRWWKSKAGLRSNLAEFTHYPSAVIGVIFILGLVFLSIYALTAYPYDKVVELWRAQGGDFYRNTWYANPKNALPAWTNLFRRDKLPETIILNSQDGSAIKSVRQNPNGSNTILIDFSFDYPYHLFPQDLVLFLGSSFTEKAPFAALRWVTPDGREFDLGGQAVKGPYGYYLSRDDKLNRKLNSDQPLFGLFGDPGANQAAPVTGTYHLRVTGVTFEPESDVDAEMVLYGQVFGLAGTDSQRRDLIIPLLWGIPVALAFGLLGAVLTSLLAMVIAAVGVWHNGWLDEMIQRITEVNMILPVLPIAIMVYMLFSKSIWVILGVLVLLSIFGSAIKTYRSVFLQVKQAPYMEAALAYGASNWRMILRYLVPRILPVLIPQLVIMVPVFVFYEATLAFLGVSDPYLPTWGKTIYDALSNANFINYPYWFLEPIVLMMFTSLAFLLVGFALERILNPHLRTS
jgi:peptide/nickel transport system permease protein